MTIQHRVLQAVEQSLKKRLANTELVVAVSGGPDSVALVKLLIELNLPALYVTHINHKLRGQASDQDEQFVRDLAQLHGLPFHCVTADVAAASGGRNIEATARRLRYAALVEIARQVGASAIATGHTADDQAETVLHRMIRGTGITGLAGILPLCRREGITIIRPLLEVRRRDVLDYLSSRSIAYRTDESNRDPKFTRNRIRAELLPVVESFSKKAVENLARLAELARQQRRIDLRRAKCDLAACELPRAGELCILDSEKLPRLTPERACRLWRLLWKREGWPQDTMGLREWRRLAEFASGSQTAIDLPGGIRVRLLPRIVRVGPGA